MAIDKRKLGVLIQHVEESFKVIPYVNDEQRTWIAEKVLGAALADLRSLVRDSRPPVLMLLGGSGEGKSSVINALAGRKIAKVGDIRPCSPRPTRYDIVFEKHYAAWKVIDTRGIFELPPAKGANSLDSLNVLIDGIVEHQPDVLLHVVAASNVRKMAPDLDAIQKIKTALEARNRRYPPTILVSNKIDVLGNPAHWPPSEFPQTAGLISEHLDYVGNSLLKTKGKAIDKTSPFNGRVFDNAESHIAIVPVACLDDRQWNISTLSTVIGEHLPKSAQLDFFQAQKRRDMLERLARQITNRFSGIAGSIGSCPIPIADILILTPLQLTLVAIIEGLSCREFSLDAASEYLASGSIATAVGTGLRWSAQQLAKFFGPVGDGMSGAIAAAGTKSIGEAAILYYFSTHPRVEGASLSLQKRKRAAKSLEKPKKDLKSKFSSAKK